MLTIHYETKIEFEKISEIGSGEGSSATFRAKDVQLDVDIAIKPVSKQDLNPADHFREARLLSKVPHPNIVPVSFASQDEEYVYLAMPYFPRGSLYTIAQHRFLTAREIVKYSLGFLSGVHYIHTKGLLHYDIKPSNILINNSDVAVLADFGIAKLTGATPPGNEPVTYWTFTAPEVLRGQATDVRSEIYQCGLTMYCLSNGPTNFEQQWSSFPNGDNAIGTGDFPNRRDFLPHIPDILKKIVNRALKLSPSDRFSSVLEMMNAVAKVDQNLDWQYRNTDDEHRWVLRSGSTVKTLVVSQKAEGTGWETKGFFEGQHQSRIRAWEFEDLSETEAFQKAHQILMSTD